VNDDPDYFTIEGTSQCRGIGLGAKALQRANARRAGKQRDPRYLAVTRPTNPKRHAGRKIAVVATDGVEEIELNTVQHYFPVARCAG